MHLREVHMENFKSFGRKLTVPFEPGFTAITGPNGSGKSNIGDAILFVLGPNSPRAIRAGRLSDLIFNGGEKGKGADHCTVSLVFDNADRAMPVEADLVTLTRRVKLTPKEDNPDGYTSYFYVNGRGSQKREFVDLLNHARISADGYNITQQGDVLRICTMSNMDRRKILDDIAGVTTFDKDIATADQRKADVAANLDRIGVVLTELTQRLSQLDKDRGAAVRYRELQEAIRRLKGQMAWRRKEDLSSQLAQLQTQVESFTKEREKQAAQLAELKIKHAEAQTKLADSERRIREEGGEEAQKLQERLTQAHAEMTRFEEKVNFAKLESQSAKEATAPMAEELRKIAKAIETETRAQTGTEAEQATATKALATAKGELESMRTAISSTDKGAQAVNRELSQLKVEHEAKQTELHEARLEADRVAERLRVVSHSLKDTESQAKATATDHDETTWQLKDLKESSGGAGKKRKEAEKKLFDLKKAQAEFARQAEEIENRIRRLQRELSDLRVNEEAAARAQGGYGRAVQEILQARDNREIKGIIGTVAELAKVDGKYQEALQIASGGRLTAIVVEDDAVAAQCIELVKKRQSGRATFLPLNKMVPGRPSGQSLMKVKEPGCLGFAIDLIEYNPRYQNAFWHVFQDTLVADNMNTGRRMMGGVRIVSLDGELFEKSGAMTGGKSKGKGDDAVAFTNSDRGRMDEIMGEIAKSELAQQDAQDRAASAAQELVTLGAQLAAEGAETASHEDRLHDIERKQEMLAERRKVLDAEVKRLTGEEHQLAAAKARLDGAILVLSDRLEELERLRVEKQKLLLKGTGKEQRERVETLERQVHELTERVLKAESRRALAVSQAELVEKRRAEVAAQLTEKEQGATRHADDIKRHTVAYTKAKAEVEALIKMQKKATGAVKGIQDARDKAYQETVDLNAKMAKAQDRMETGYGLISNARGRMPVIEENLGDAMMELKANPFEPATGEVVPPVEDLKREMRNQEASLDRLGPVNQRALEEYEAESTRKSELTTEVSRLEAQRVELVNLVTEISTRKKAAFMTVFERLNENFTTVYKEISTGGQAYMELEDPVDPFAGGLILKAQPPGKKVLRIDALSGGEKSLTSMAFIFAIQRDDPSPFYYFDEVDQNLDAVNSELLAKMIKENARYAQFIVVSLRKITLKEASHIYGVTQQSPGLSEIIAHFDIDTLRDENKPELGQGADGEADLPDPVASKGKKAKKEPKGGKETKETTITGLLERAMNVQVKP